MGMATSERARTYVCALGLVATMATAGTAAAADVYVSSATAFQAALNAAQGGDTIYLAPGTYSGNFKLPVHGGAGYVTVRTAPGAIPLPPAGTRITPDVSSGLARLVSPNSSQALRTAAGAAFWRLELFEVAAGPFTSTTLIDLGDGSPTQNDLSQVPHHLVLDRLYVHGDRLLGQKRAIGLNSGDTTIINSYVAEIKALGSIRKRLPDGMGPVRT